MPTTTDQIRTELVLDAGAYTSKMRAASAETSAFARHAHNAAQATGNLALSMAKAGAQAGLATIGVGIAATAAGTVALGKGALDAAASWEELTTKFTFFLNSADAAQQKLDFVRRLAGPSKFTTEALADVGFQLEANRLKLETWLPIVSDFATVSSHGAEALGEMAGALGRIRAGDFGEAFERLRELGVSREDLAAEGLQFNRGGQFLGDVNQALTAVEAIARKRFGGIGQAFADTITGKVSSFQDAWEQAMNQIGEQMAPFAKRVLDFGADALARLVDANIFGQITANWMKGMEAANFEGAFQGIIAKVGALLWTLPDIWSEVMNQMTIRAHIFSLRVAAFIAEMMGNVIPGFAGGNAMTEQAQSLRIAASAVEGAFEGAGVLDNKKLLQTDLRKQREAEIMKALTEPRAATEAATAEPFEPGPLADLANPLQEVARNTAQIARNTSNDMLRRNIFGGGELGRHGISPVEMGAARRAIAGHLNLDRLAEGVRGIVQDEIERVFFRRRGFAGGG